MTRRALAHSLSDEIRRRPQATPYRPTWRDDARDAVEILAGVVVLGTLIFGLPLLIWLVAGGVR